MEFLLASVGLSLPISFLSIVVRAAAGLVLVIVVIVIVGATWTVLVVVVLGLLLLSDGSGGCRLGGSLRCFGLFSHKSN